ncbi:MAG: putative bifunctional diguanylate cyclase/phosphodiesterase [Mycobacteriales bacterium]
MSRARLAITALLLLGGAGYLLLPEVPASIAETLWGLVCVVVLGCGIRRRQAPDRTRWWFLLAGLGFQVLGDALWSAYDVRGVTPPALGAADMAYLAGYPMLFVSLALLVRRRGRPDASAWLDAGMWTGGALIISWLPLLSGPAHDPALTAAQRTSALAYPVMDLLLLLLVLHVVVRRGHRDAGDRLVALSMAAMLVADVVFGIRSLSGSYRSGELTDFGWLLCYGLAAAAVWRPATAVPSAMLAARPSQRRLLALVAPAITAPAVLALLLWRGNLTGDVAGGYVVAGATTVLFLLAAVRASLLVAHMRQREAALQVALDDREALAQELRQRATTCPLTGLVNRTGFLDLVEEAIRLDEPLAVGLLDLDDFKGVNDTLGHDAGDALLVKVAGRLRNATGARDVVGRLGGDEFALLLRGTPDEVERKADLVVAALRRPLLIEGHEFHVAGSLGVVPRSDTSSMGDLLRRADLAMYAAKADGGSRWAGYQPSMSAALLKRVDLRSQLVLALERGELVPWYQPVVDLDTGELVGCEALARWVRRGRPPEAPGEWMALAEETGFIVDIDQALQARALRDFADWRAASPGAREMELALNVSGRTLQASGTADHLLGLLADLRIPPNRLLLEVTEGVLLEDEAVGRRLQRLRAAGVRIALDDFGTGWSSLAYLARFPVDVLKLDRSFTAGLGQDLGSEAVAAAVVQLARALDLEVIAEGVETEAQGRHLQALGTRWAQGYLFGAAVPSEVLRRRLLEEPAQRRTRGLHLA